MTIHANAGATGLKSCFRCGATFANSDGQRVCWSCRKPKARTRNLIQKNLTFRERQVVDLVSQGKANKEIAFTLILSEGTIKEYLNRIFRKVQVTNRTELAIWALTQKAMSESSHHEGRKAFEPRSLVV